VGTKPKGDQKVLCETKAFFKKHNVKSVVMSEDNLEYPHEEGEDLHTFFLCVAYTQS